MGEPTPEDEAFIARLNHVEFANRIATALGLHAADEHPFDSLVQAVARLREVAALKHPNDLRERNDKLAANNGALSNRATKAEGEVARISARLTVLEQETKRLDWFAANPSRLLVVSGFATSSGREEFYIIDRKPDGSGYVTADGPQSPDLRVVLDWAIQYDATRRPPSETTAP